jgi:hypothetical protein
MMKNGLIYVVSLVGWWAVKPKEISQQNFNKITTVNQIHKNRKILRLQAK